MSKRKNSLVFFIFGLTLFLFQFLGYNVVSLGLLLTSSLALLHISNFPNNYKANREFVWFLILAIGGALMHMMNGLPTTRSLQVWGQFFYFSILFLMVKNKKDILLTIKAVVYIIALLDIFTNLLLFVGIDLPWAHLPSIRPGETIPRYPGVKGNQLYSGSITYAAICLFVSNRNWNTVSVLCLLSLLFNIILSGSNRYFIIIAIVFLLFFYKLYEKKKQLFIVYLSTILLVAGSALYEVSKTDDMDSSNAKRVYLWGITINNILSNPVTGIGLFSPDLSEDFTASVENLEEAGVTESTILSVALCFGVPCVIIFLLSLFKTLKAFTVYRLYGPELGLFIGFSLDLFWGGSLENSISLCVFVLSMYLINDNHMNYGRKNPLFNNNTYV